VDALAPRDRTSRRLRTFTGFDPELGGEAEQIDWLLVTPDLTVADAWVVPDPAGPGSPSDHRAVVADLVMAPQAGRNQR
jgi:endonuclease/exonuclease/phosphatase family metal-dependent hydrolase